jgi:hypothetical protein
MLNALKTILALTLVSAETIGALAGREELNGGFHGDTPYQATSSQFIASPSARDAFA